MARRQEDDEPLTEHQEKTVRWTIAMWIILFAAIVGKVAEAVF